MQISNEECPWSHVQCVLKFTIEELCPLFCPVSLSCTYNSILDIQYVLLYGIGGIAEKKIVAMHHERASTVIY